MSFAMFLTAQSFLLTPHRITLSALAKTLGGITGILDLGFGILDFRLSGHRITRSALAKTFGGIVKPICFAVLRLMTNSNFVGC